LKVFCRPVLVVDDDHPIRELISAVVESAGYTTIQVDSGEAALASAGEHQPSLVLLDVCLPGVSGYEVCHQLRQRFGPSLPIIFLSGERIEGHDRAAGLLIGADDYMVKPFFPDELAARVRRLLARSESNTMANAGSSPPAPLSQREREVLELLAEGLRHKAIATELYISPKTVATHIQRILTKLGVHSRAEAVAHAFRFRLVRAPML
jgi:DNA-binding NarL/FixJ family response regulator